MLCEALRATSDLGLRENIVQLLWDLEAHTKECHFEPGARRRCEERAAGRSRGARARVLAVTAVHVAAGRDALAAVGCCHSAALMGTCRVTWCSCPRASRPPLSTPHPTPTRTHPAPPTARAEDVLALLAVLEATSNAHIASHILHLLCHCISRADAPEMSREQMQRESYAGPAWCSRPHAWRLPPLARLPCMLHCRCLLLGSQPRSKSRSPCAASCALYR